MALFPHQRHSVDDMAALEDTRHAQWSSQQVPTSCGLLCNAMGSGKTRVLLARVQATPVLPRNEPMWVHQRLHPWYTDAAFATRLAWLTTSTARHVSHWLVPDGLSHLYVVPYNLVLCTKAVALHWEAEARCVAGLPPLTVVRAPRQISPLAQRVADRSLPAGSLIVVPDTYADAWFTQVLACCFPPDAGRTPAHGSSAASSVMHSPLRVRGTLVDADVNADADADATDPSPDWDPEADSTMDVDAPRPFRPPPTRIPATLPLGGPGAGLGSGLWQRPPHLVCWNRVVLDDPQTMRLRTTHHVLGRFMWMLCATPHDLWAWWTDARVERCPNVCKDALPSLVVYHQSDWVAPPVRRLQYAVRGSLVADVCADPWVQNALGTDALTRLHAGDWRGLVPEAPGAPTRPAHEELLARLDREIQAAPPDRAPRLEAQRQGLADRIQAAMAHAECLVCCGDTPDALLHLTGCCQHVLCAGCWVSCQRQQGKCPVCRQALPSVQNAWTLPVPLVTGSTAPAPAPAPASAPRSARRRREDVLLALLRWRGAAARLVVYAWADAALSYIQAALEPHGYMVVDVSGTLAHIERKLHAFQTGRAPVLFLNARHHGAGLNLTCATDVVLYHQMHTAGYDQIVGRALRYPRTEPLWVHMLCHAAEVTGPQPSGNSTDTWVPESATLEVTWKHVSAE